VEQNPLNENPNSGSLPEINLHTATGDERLVGVLFKEMQELKCKVHELETKKILEETQLPPEILAANGMLPDEPTTVGRGRAFRPLLRSEIEEAMKVSPFCSDQAKHLKVYIGTYRKYAKALGLWKPQPHHKGSRKSPWGPEKGKYPLSKVIIGEFNNNPKLLEWMVRKKLLKSKTFPEECAHCGYKERHIITKRVPLLLDHLDGDELNWKLENLRLLCWNCTVQVGRGYICGRLKKFDPNFLQEEGW
jgi:5-methylcytosine-specific restriction endonuclease McrA